MNIPMTPEEAAVILSSIDSYQHPELCTKWKAIQDKLSYQHGKKTHFINPNGVFSCGRVNSWCPDYYSLTTTDRSAVTCKQCLKKLNI